MGFNSLQTGKRIASPLNTACRGGGTMLGADGFNSLQTGKRIARHFPEEGRGGLMSTCFNSLQTGKRIASEWLCGNN